MFAFRHDPLCLETEWVSRLNFIGLSKYMRYPEDGEIRYPLKVLFFKDACLQRSLLICHKGNIGFRCLLTSDMFCMI